MHRIYAYFLILMITSTEALCAFADTTKVAMFQLNNLIFEINEPHLFNVKEVETLFDLRDTVHPDQTITSNIERILKYFEDRGYPFSQVDVDSVVLRDDSDLITFISIDPGPLTRINSIRISGNKITRPEVILRELRIRAGDVYDQIKINKIPSRIRKLGFFKEVDEAQLLMNEKGEGELIINVTEGNMNDVDGVVGYNPGTNQNKGYFTGLIDISLANFLGTGRKIDTYWEKKDLKTQQLKLRYLEPWVLGYPFHIGGSFEQLIQDTSYIQRDWKLDVSLPVTDNLTLFSNIGNEKVTPDSIGSVLFNIPKSNSWLLNMGLNYDTRNNLINPRKGIFYQTTFEMGRKKTDAVFEVSGLAASSFNRKRISLDVELLVPFMKWQVLSIELHGRQVSANKGRISISDMYRFGGSKSLRGFREDEFIGSQIAWSNLEYRYLLSSLSRAFVFLDSGYYTRDNYPENDVEGYRFGYGFGIRLDTRLGIVGVDYGLARGRSLTNGLVHVRLVNKF